MLFKIKMTETLKQKLVSLADKYETPDFIKNDPSRFMHAFLPQNGTDIKDAEVAAFISANLAFGRREQILSHIQLILNEIQKKQKTPSQWILDGDYSSFFTDSKKSFYRMYTFSDMRIFFDSIKSFLIQKHTLGEFFKEKYEQACNSSCQNVYLHSVIASCFTQKCALISSSKGGAAKKLNMFLRWMVRTDSPVDLGLWSWYDKAKLLMPLDTHVMQESVKFGFLEKTANGKIPAANLKTAVELTRKMNEFFPGDPVRADYALFGLGVDREFNLNN